MKAPDVKTTETCADVAPQDPLNSLDEHVFQYEMNSPEKTPGDLLGERLKEIMSPKKPRITD